MPRIARPVFPGVPHHITQRGNWREIVFFTDGDRAAYLSWLANYCAKDESYLWAAIRYVERNPVLAGMVRRAED